MSYQWGNWSRRSSNETCSSDTLTHFLNTSASSPRSSNASLPLSEDTLRQHQQEWEHIERIFYGEEPLPADEKTRQEFLDWMETFPYIRVTGRKVNTERFRIPNRNPIYQEELLAGDRLKSGLDRRFGERESMEYTKGDLPGLRGLSMTPRQVTSVKAKDVGSLTARPSGLPSTTSAKIFRLPSIGYSGGSGSKDSANSNSNNRNRWTNSGKPSPLTATVTLPSIPLDKLVTFGDLLTSRSISAMHNTQHNNQETSREGLLNRRISKQDPRR